MSNKYRKEVKMTEKEIIHRLRNTTSSKKFFNEVTMLPLYKIEKLYDQMLSINQTKYDVKTRVALFNFNCNVLDLLNLIYDYRRNKENDWERFRKDKYVS